MIGVSVVIPVYNSELYLRECLNSLISQTYADFEIICVDDCSTDKSLDILREYENGDHRVKVICNNSNLGAGESRNIGIQLARGEYLAILDADDYFESTLLEKTYKLCKENQADVGIYDYTKFDNVSKAEFKCSLALTLFQLFDSKVINFVDKKDFIFHSFGYMCWNKLYRKDFIIENEVKFQNLEHANDIFFSLIVFLKSERIIYMKSLGALVHYRINTPSQITNHREKNIKCVWKAYVELKNYMLKNDLFVKYSKEFFSAFIWQNTDLIIILKEKEEVQAKRLYEFIRKYGLQELKMSSCQEKDFLSKFSYNLYTFLRDNEYQEGSLEKLFFLKFWDTEKTKELFQYLRQHNYKCALWGMGRYGKLFLKVCEIEQFELYGVIDLNTTRQEKRFGNYIVQGVENIEDTVNAVMITNSFYGKGIAEILENNNRDIKIIDLESYCKLGMKIEDCII